MRQEVRVEGLQSALWSSAVVRDAAGEELVFFGCAAGGVGALRPAEDGVWAPLRGTRFHSHDVRAMAAFEGGVVSASLDARMCVFAPADFVDRRDVTWVLPYHGCVGQPPVQFSRQARFILARRMRGIDLWGLPEDAASPPLKLRMNLKSFRGEVSACAISAGGHMIAVAGLDAFRLYQVWDGVGSAPDSPSFGKVKPLDVPVRVERLLSAAWDLAFCGAALVCIVQSKMSLAVYQDGQVMVIKKEEVGSTAFSLERIACVNGGVGVADSRGHVFYARLAPEWANGDVQLKWTRVFKPEDDKVVAVSAMSFAPSGTSLAIATSALKVFIARTEEADADADTDADKMVSAGSFSGVITSVSFADKEESVLVSGEKFCSVMCTTPSWRKRKHDEDAQTPGFEPYALRVGDSILGTCVLSSSRIVVVRRRWDLVQYSESLPDAIPKKPFGH
ncbi:unnamed protein product [Chondrus crispus]|uniref:Uncharacterized protein n=1 Tax=Chondrus crispus TaxID=2769 RepID=R7Q457_CHOCR|nr:unnamed protein product [Chondrus crispus]CDF32126.1 unnamed protein product [Chondrus crispus]|eukprot:XP_005711791.1 unnamed protein product [Chondrus crispus]